MTKKRFTLKPYDGIRCDVFDGEIEIAEVHRDDAKGLIDLLNALHEENEKLKKGMIEVVDRYIRNIEHNPPSSTRTYFKVKGALNNVREGLRDLLGDLE